MRLAGYEITERLHHSSRTVVYKARAPGKTGCLVLKTSASEQPTAGAVARLRTEYELGRRIDHPHVVRPLNLALTEHRPVVVFEDFGGQALAARLERGALDIGRFCRLAVGVARGLQALHAGHIIHKDLNPSNLIYRESTEEIKIADLGIATVLSGEAQRANSPDRIEGTLPYISPEQTGRVNRSIDFRSDFYSLGATFYESLCGRPPFLATDPMELVYCHIAQPVRPPVELDSKIPVVLSELVLRLLEKNPENRYQSAHGLALDLEECERRLVAAPAIDGGERVYDIEGFQLALQDASSEFNVPEKLFGRRRETDRLMDAFSRAADGSRQLVLVVADSGGGKSRLVSEIHRPIIERQGWYVRGHFDELQRDVPHVAFSQALGEIARQILSSPQDQAQVWRRRLEEAVGADAAILVDLVPDLGLLLGQKPDAVAVDANEAEIRFRSALQRLIGSIADANSPLVLFLDDAQWADSASLHLLESLLADDSIHHLLVVCAVRPDALSAGEPLHLALADIRRVSAEITEIELPALQSGHIAQLLGETLQTSVSEVQRLAEVVHAKTQGNPLFVNQFLRLLHAEGLLAFNAQERRWRWDLNEIACHAIAEDVVDLLLEKVGKLPRPTRRVLQLAACIGTRFDLGTLATVAEQSVHEVVIALREAFEQGIIRNVCGGFGRMLALPEPEANPCTPEEATPITLLFAHDRFRQGIYEQLTETERVRVHVRLGRMLRDRIDLAAPDSRLFTVVNHFSVGLPEVTDPAERKDLAKLNYLAGIRASEAVAFERARRYFSAAIELLPAECWQVDYELTFDLYLRLYKCLNLDRDLARQGHALGEELLGHARNLTDRLLALSPHVQQLARSLQPETALRLALGGLQEAGIEIDVPDADDQVRAGCQRVLSRAKQHGISEIARLPAIADKDRAAVAELLGAIMFPAYMRRRDLVPVATLRIVELTIAHGNTPQSAMAFATWGRIIAHSFGDFAEGCRFAELARQLSERFGVDRAGTIVISSGMVLWLQQRLAQTVDEMLVGFRVGQETGAPFFAGLAASLIPSHSFAAGLPLEQIHEQAQPLLRYVEEHMGRIGVREIHLVLRAVEVLLGRRPATQPLFDHDVEEEQALRAMRVKNPEGALQYCLLSCRLAYLQSDFRTALSFIERAHSYADRSLGIFAAYDLQFHYAIAAAGLQRNDPSTSRLALVQAKVEMLKGWVRSGTGANLLHKYLLASAELARLQDSRETGAAFERAIKAAADSGFLHDQALANELAGQYYLERGLEKVARVYLQEARYCYERWGAKLKVRLLEEAHPFLRANDSATPNTGELLTVSRTGSLTVEGQSQFLDLTTLFKATQTISGEIDPATLMRQLLTLLAENAGAQWAALVIDKGTLLCVCATLDAGSQDGLKLLAKSPHGLDDDQRIPVGIVRYVARTRKAVVLHNASGEGSFRSDAQVTQRRLRSVLCAPMINRGRLVGAVYLENNLYQGVFTPQRLEVVELLCAQAAISLDNAQLYKRLEEYSRTLEQKVEERTHDLEQKNEELALSLQAQREMQDQLIVSEKMAALGSLAAGVSHEVNSPVGALNSAAEVMRFCVDRVEKGLAGAVTIEEARADQRLKRALVALRENSQNIVEAGQRVARIAHSLATFAGLDQAELRLLDLHEGLESALVLLGRKLAGKIEIRREFGDLPQILCYASEINQVLMSLLKNAVEAIPARGTIAISTEAGDRSAAVSVRDDGVGMRPDQVSELFNFGFSRRRNRVRMGMGLKVAHAIVKKHQGELSAKRNNDGRGMTFVLRLPVDGPRPA